MHPPIILKYASLYKPCTGNANNLRARLPPDKHVPSIQKCIIHYHTINKNLCRKYRCATRKIGLSVIICVINEATCRARFLSQASTPSAKLCAVQDSNPGKEDALLPYRISRKTYTKFSHILQSAIPCQSSHKSCIHFTNWSRIITARWIFHQILYYFFAHQNIIVKFAIDRDYAKTNNSFSKNRLQLYHHWSNLNHICVRKLFFLNIGKNFHFNIAHINPLK